MGLKAEGGTVCASFLPRMRPSPHPGSPLPPPPHTHARARSFNTVNAEYQVVAKAVEAASEEFREFERKDIKYRCVGV